MLKLLDLFSGIGGFSLAAQWTGQIETVAFCEIDPFCQKVLKKHWPTVPIISDIREVTGERIRKIVADTIDKGLFGGCRGSDTDRNGVQAGEQTGDIARGATARCDENHIDILTGGFPCQPFSCAGKREGTADNRFLWPEMLRVIREVHPTWVIAENVRGLLSIDNGVVFENCCASLEALGYEVQPFVIPACAVNAPHRRDRVWIVAKSNGGRKPQSGVQQTGVFAESDRNAPDTDLPRSQGRDEHRECTGERSFGPGHTEQWAEDWYTVALRTCVRDLDDGVSGKLAGRHRVSKLKALGNSIVPQVAFAIMQAIIKVEKENA